MKKLFFFRSSASSNNGNKPSPPSPSDTEIYWENPFENGLNNQTSNDKVGNSFRSPRGLFSKSRKQESQNSATRSGLRRSRSLSSAAFQGGRLGHGSFASFSDQIRSPSSSSNGIPLRQSDHSPRCRALPPEYPSEKKRLESETLQNTHEIKRPGSAGSFDSLHDSSGSSSHSSSNASTKIVDRYIDGEEQEERSRVNNCSSQRNHTGNGNGGGRRPPRVQYTAPASPAIGTKEKPRSNSFRETKGTCLHFSSKDCTGNGFGHESPRRLAKNVIERLSQCHVLPKTSSNGFDSGIPITIEDIYGGSLNRCSSSNLDGLAKKNCPMDELYETTEGHYGEDFSGFQKQSRFLGENCGGFNAGEIEEDIDVELHRKLKEAKERVMFLSEELEEESFIRDPRFDVSRLIKTIRNLTEERVSLALEVSALLESRVTERAAAKEELSLIKAEMDGRTWRLEKEKNELQSGLEKELDRRSSDWSSKLERYKSEEQRLRDRVRELAEQNVSLQREVSSLSESEMESRSMMTYSEQQLKDLTMSLENVTNENQNLRQNLTELQEMYRGAEEVRDCVHRNYEEKEKECKELHKSITRLLRTCGEQEKTIEGLREGHSGEFGKKQSVEKFDKQVRKLQLEQIRLTGVEQALRKEVESCRLEVNSLRHENVSLLNRLRVNVREGGCLTVKLDQELWTRISCLQNQGLSLLNESTQLCSKLLEFIKRKAVHTPEVNLGLEAIKNGLDGKFLIEFETKVQGLKRGTESLARSLQTMSALLHEKSNPLDLELQSKCGDDDGSVQLSTQSSEDIVKSELKSETLLTSLLREKMYSKELEIEQLQAELATAVRGNDILRCEVQNALDNLSCANHKLKDIEFQMLKKDENISWMQNDLQESTKELTITRGILPKVSEERDLMWEEVMQYSEKNMLLNKEVIELKKKVEALDEAILVKEGEMAILKDTLGKKPFDLLSSPDSMQEFLLN